jgi:two-component system, cell cycle sensor histidine kinase and response regulator CckA
MTAAGPGSSLDVEADRVGPPVKSIFLVEDEPQIRRLIVRVLEREGFVVESTDDPELALARIAELGEAVDLVLTDVLMPGMTGPVLVRELRARMPNVRVLFMSGYAGESMEEELAIRDARMLRKPFTPSELVATVRAVLG